MLSARRSLTVSLAACLAGYLQAVLCQQRCLILAFLLSCSDLTAPSVTTMWPSTIRRELSRWLQSPVMHHIHHSYLENITTPTSRR
jgi:sterol desaturase/sphingolipid hydroxylase (fatty acid hydroxylase superfamily)